MQTSVIMRIVTSLAVIVGVVGFNDLQVGATDRPVAKQAGRMEVKSSIWSQLHATFSRLRSASSKKAEPTPKVAIPSNEKKLAGIKSENSRLKSSAVISVELSHGAKLPPFRVTRRLKLSGTLKVRIKGRRPQLGDSFEVLHAGWIEGEFERLELPRLPKGLKWHIVYESIRDQRDHDRDGRADVRIIVIRNNKDDPHPRVETQD